MKRLVAYLFLACPLFAGEYAVLRSGFRVHSESHLQTGDSTRLLTKTGSMDFPSSEIVRFEVEEYTPPPPQKAPEPPAVVPDIPRATPQELVQQAALKHGLRPEFVASVASAESAFRTDALSPKGAIGLMQLMPGTAGDLGVNPHDPAQNAEAGARYLKQLLLKYAHSKDPVRFALAAYNAGPGAVDRYRNIPPYRETQHYVERVLRKYMAELKTTSQQRNPS